MENLELNPCPCCGSDKVTIQETEGCDYLIGCDNCGLQMFDDMKWGEEGFDSRENVTGKWNTRTEPPKVEEALINRFNGIVRESLSELNTTDEDFDISWTEYEAEILEKSLLTKIRNVLEG